MACPSAVDESLEGTNAIGEIVWDYANDLVTVSYDPDSITPARLAQVITQDRFTADSRDTPDAPDSSDAIAGLERAPAPVPEGAPEFFARAFDEARKAKRAIVVSFGAKWCPACQRLEKETLGHPDVADVLSNLQVVEVDLDESPELGHWYGVTAVPHVFLIDVDGIIVDSVRSFEPPQTFLGRLKKLIDA